MHFANEYCNISLSFLLFAFCIDVKESIGPTSEQFYCNCVLLVRACPPFHADVVAIAQIVAEHVGAVYALFCVHHLSSSVMHCYVLL